MTTTPSVDSVSAADSDLTSPQFTDDLLSALAQGVELEEYLTGRSATATHDELIDAHYRLVNIEPYIRARTSGATHIEVFDVIAWRRIDLYASACNIGNSTRRILTEYATARTAGATHAECKDIAARTELAGRS
jgi:hypothetical protein